ncbi:hypothetical protein KIPB_002203 [Kipferlia bialata]|uniref:Kinesin motor domain-containing protein n=1 Tax=Kipferlia bialata TaxID=797122 RepID=A0A9K3GG10_9EUKA|nr:hypothetical protein KIPB_002203 [Kipferlia bialata]|eukprot:g2203.t1
MSECLSVRTSSVLSSTLGPTDVRRQSPANASRHRSSIAMEGFGSADLEKEAQRKREEKEKREAATSASPISKETPEIEGEGEAEGVEGEGDAFSLSTTQPLSPIAEEGVGGIVVEGGGERESGVAQEVEPRTPVAQGEREREVERERVDRTAMLEAQLGESAAREASLQTQLASAEAMLLSLQTAQEAQTQDDVPLLTRIEGLEAEVQRERALRTSAEESLKDRELALREREGLERELASLRMETERDRASHAERGAECESLTSFAHGVCDVLDVEYSPERHGAILSHLKALAAQGGVGAAKYGRVMHDLQGLRQEADALRSSLVSETERVWTMMSEVKAVVLDGVAAGLIEAQTAERPTGPVRLGSVYNPSPHAQPPRERDSRDTYKESPLMHEPHRVLPPSPPMRRPPPAGQGRSPMPATGASPSVYSALSPQTHSRDTRETRDGARSHVYVSLRDTGDETQKTQIRLSGEDGVLVQTSDSVQRYACHSAYAAPDILSLPSPLPLFTSGIDTVYRGGSMLVVSHGPRSCGKAATVLGNSAGYQGVFYAVGSALVQRALNQGPTDTVPEIHVSAMTYRVSGAPPGDSAPVPAPVFRDAMLPDQQGGHPMERRLCRDGSGRRYVSNVTKVAVKSKTDHDRLFSHLLTRLGPTDLATTAVVLVVDVLRPLPDTRIGRCMCVVLPDSDPETCPPQAQALNADVYSMLQTVARGSTPTCHDDLSLYLSDAAEGDADVFSVMHVSSAQRLSDTVHTLGQASALYALADRERGRQGVIL